MLYDSPAWNWGQGYCTKHAGQSLPCRICIDGHDPDLIKPVAQIFDVEIGTSKILGVTNVETFRSPEPQFEEKNIKVKAVIDPVPNKAQMSLTISERLGLSVKPDCNAAEAQVAAVFNKESIAKEILDNLKKSVMHTCVKPSQPPAHLMTGVSEGIEPIWSNVFKGRKAGSGIPLHNIQSTSADLGKALTQGRWRAGESVDLFFNLPPQIKGVVQDVHRLYPKVRYSVLVRAAHLTLDRLIIIPSQVPVQPWEQVAVELVCSLTAVWRCHLAELQEGRDGQAGDRPQADAGDQRPDDQGSLGQDPDIQA